MCVAGKTKSCFEILTTWRLRKSVLNSFNTHIFT